MVPRQVEHRKAGREHQSSRWLPRAPTRYALNFRSSPSQQLFSSLPPSILTESNRDAVGLHYTHCPGDLVNANSHPRGVPRPAERPHQHTSLISTESVEHIVRRSTSCAPLPQPLSFIISPPRTPLPSDCGAIASTHSSGRTNPRTSPIHPPPEIISRQAKHRPSRPPFIFWRARLRVVQLQPFACAQETMSICPPLSACTQVILSQGQPFSRAHFRTSRCPICAAPEHVRSFQGHPIPLAHSSTSAWPPQAAAQHTSSSQGHPFAMHHCSTERCPPPAA